MTTFNEYQNLALRTANHGLYEGDEKLDLAVLGLGLAGESGEAADMIKKYIGHGHAMNHAKLRKELGDVLWYVMVIANRFGMDAEEVVQANIDKLRERYPDGFSNEASINRTS